MGINGADMKNAFCPAVILLPPSGADFSKWSVYDCVDGADVGERLDAIKRFVGEAPSAFRCNVPKSRLSSLVPSDAVRVNTAMRNYLYNYIESVPFGMIYTERTSANGETTRKSIVCALDLDEYAVKSDSVDEKLTASCVRVRAGASIEFASAVLTVADAEKNVFASVSHTGSAVVYDFVPHGSNERLVGYGLDSASCERIKESLSKLDFDAITVSEGEASLAAAKEWWDYLKRNLPESERKTHPARYTLVEISDSHPNGDVSCRVEARRLKSDGELIV